MALSQINDIQAANISNDIMIKSILNFIGQMIGDGNKLSPMQEYIDHSINDLKLLGATKEEQKEMEEVIRGKATRILNAAISDANNNIKLMMESEE